MRFSYRKCTLILLVLLILPAIPALMGIKGVYSAVFSISWQWALLFIGLTLLRWYCVTARFQIGLKANQQRLRKRTVFGVELAKNFAADATPIGIGGTPASLLLYKQKHVPMWTTAATGLFMLVLDIFAVFCWLSLAILLAFTNQIEGVSASSRLILVIAIGAFVLVFLIFFQRQRLVRWLSRLPLHRLVPAKHRQHTQQWCRQALAALHQLGALQWPDRCRVLFYSLINWGVRFCLLFLAMQALGHTAFWPHIALIHFVSTLAGMLTFIPGGFPGTDLSIAVLLSAELSTRAILSVLLLWRLVSYYISFLTGLIAFVLVSLTTTPKNEIP